MPNPIGKPPAFKAPTEMLAKFMDYIHYCDENKRFINIAGFCVFCGIHKDTYYEYKNNKADYSDSIKNIETILEDSVFHSHLSPPEKIFYLKNKFGYADKQEIQQTTVNIDTESDDDFIANIKSKYLKDT